MPVSPNAKNEKTDIKKIICEDELSIKEDMSDAGLSIDLEKKEGEKQYEMTLRDLGYVSTILRKIRVKAEFFEKQNKIEFTGEKFKFSLDLDDKQMPKRGMLDVTGSESKKTLGPRKLWPTHEAMLCGKYANRE